MLNFTAFSPKTVAILMVGLLRPDNDQRNSIRKNLYEPLVQAGHLVDAYLCSETSERATWHATLSSSSSSIRHRLESCFHFVQTKARYDVYIRTRPDLLVYAPMHIALDVRGIQTRMRVLDSTEGTPRRASSFYCDSLKLRAAIDDQFGVISAQFARAYFADVHTPNGIFKQTWEEYRLTNKLSESELAIPVVITPFPIRLVKSHRGGHTPEVNVSDMCE